MGKEKDEINYYIVRFRSTITYVHRDDVRIECSDRKMAMKLMQTALEGMPSYSGELYYVTEKEVKM